MKEAHALANALRPVVDRWKRSYARGTRIPHRRQQERDDIAAALDAFDNSAAALMGATPASQANHPNTSRQAAITVQAGTQRHQALWLVEHITSRFSSPMATADFVAEEMDRRGWRPNMSQNQASSRLDELHTIGYVERTGAYALTRTDSEAAVWALTDAGRAALRKLGDPD